MPMELLGGFGGVGVEFWEVAGATRGEFVRERFTGNFFESMNHFKNRGGVAGAEVVGNEAGLQPLDSGEVATG